MEKNKDILNPISGSQFEGSPKTNFQIAISQAKITIKVFIFKKLEQNCINNPTKAQMSVELKEQDQASKEELNKRREDRPMLKGDQTSEKTSSEGSWIDFVYKSAVNEF